MVAVNPLLLDDVDSNTSSSLLALALSNNVGGPVPGRLRLGIANCALEGLPCALFMFMLAAGLWVKREELAGLLMNNNVSTASCSCGVGVVARIVRVVVVDSLLSLRW